MLLITACAPRGLLGETMRLRIAWGGGSERLWDGTVSIDQGAVAEPRSLGIEADEPGSMWLESDPQSASNRLRIRQRSARSYDGVDLLITAPLQAKLVIRLVGNDDPERPVQVEVPLAELLNEFFDQELDGRGNRLLVRRTPGDSLLVDLEQDSLIFSPGENFRFTLQPHLLPLPDDSEVKIKSQLVRLHDGKELWEAEHEVRSGHPEPISLDVDLPEEEGVYDLNITATRSASWVRKPLEWSKTVSERKVQVLVLGPQRPELPVGTSHELQQVGDEIDPANPEWSEKLGLDKLPKLPKLPRLWNGPFGNDNMKITEHALGKLARLNPNSESPDVSWQAYPLSIKEPGRPHFLEFEYPSDVSQTLSMSVLEPNAAGALMPIALDSGIDVSKEVGGNEKPVRWLRHRLIFWPRTTTPLVLLANLRDHSPAMYGKIRVFSGGEHLPKAFADEPQQGQRAMLAYLDRPLFPENFSARESLDDWSRRSLDDWRTFYEGGTRLVEYLQHAGYNGLMVSALADGSTIYPSRILQPTPRFDRGIFFATGQDPVRKDILEMLFRQFDREGLQLIPAIEFAAPLPELEAIRRQEGAAAATIEWIGPDGATWSQTNPARRGLAPYYNVLHPRVQEAMLRVVRELIGKYAHHKSFAALAIRLSAHGYAQLPGPEWGMDDATIARFCEDTGLPTMGTGPTRFAQRARFLNSENHRPAWLRWRAAQLSQFYHSVLAELTTIQPGSRLYLATADTLVGSELENELRPSLSRRTTIAEALLRVGIDAEHYRHEAALVLLRGERVVPKRNLSARAVNLTINQMPDVAEYFRRLPVPGSLFFHPPQEIRIESFDRKSPVKPSYAQLFAQPVPSSCRNRQRFVHSLATLDSQVMVDGGWMLPMGQEQAVRDLVAAYRRLPAVRFRQAQPGRDPQSSQPVTFRYVTHGNRTYAYAVNDAPFGVTARVRVEAAAGCRMEELSGMRQAESLKRDARGTYWPVELRPYDMVAVQLSAANAKLYDPTVEVPASVTTALGQRINALGARTASLRNPASPLNALANPGFEQPPLDSERLPGWATTERKEVSIVADPTQKHGGKQSVHLKTSGPWACLVSQPFKPPATGRVQLSVWLRVADASVQPSLRLALEGKRPGKPYYPWAPVGSAPGATARISSEWAPYVFPVGNLPLQGLSQLRVRFDLLGPGEVWIDDVQLFDMKFENHELTELHKLITTAHVMLQNRHLGDCMRLLDGYWPQFLEENVPLQLDLARRVARPRPPIGRTPEESPGIIDRVKGWLPNPFR